MAEEIIYCPSCNHKLRVPEEMLGQTVQCPLCQLVFTTPTRANASIPVVRPVAPPTDVQPTGPYPAGVQPLGPPPALWASDPADTAEKALTKVRPPAIALLVIGIIGWLLNAVSAVFSNIGGAALAAKELNDQRNLFERLAGPEAAMQDAALTPEQMVSVKLAMFVGLLLACTGIIVGAIQMLRLRGYGLAVCACFLAALNFNSCCCIPGAAIGIWALVVLMSPEVRRAFE